MGPRVEERTSDGVVNDSAASMTAPPQSEKASVPGHPIGIDDPKESNATATDSGDGKEAANLEELVSASDDESYDGLTKWWCVLGIGFTLVVASVVIFVIELRPVAAGIQERCGVDPLPLFLECVDMSDMYCPAVGIAHSSDDSAGPDDGFRGNQCNEAGEVTSVVQGSMMVMGTIPTEIGSLTAANYLDFYDNCLTGTLPTEIGLMTSMTDMDLWRNDLQGSIPTELGRLTKLKYLGLDYNRLVGNMDPIFCDADAPALIDRNRFPNLWELRADCESGGVVCSCCTECTDSVSWDQWALQRQGWNANCYAL